MHARPEPIGSSGAMERFTAGLDLPNAAGTIALRLPAYAEDPGEMQVWTRTCS